MKEEEEDELRGGNQSTQDDRPQAGKEGRVFPPGGEGEESSQAIDQGQKEDVELDLRLAGGMDQC